MTPQLLAASALAALVLYGLAFGGGLPSAYARRRCQGRAWRNAFPTASKAEIRDYLSLFADAFAVRDTHKLQFRPDDTILSIYRAWYRYPWMADALELETLAEAIETRHGLRLENLWTDDLTLGQLFVQTRRPD
ncbi:hypothetical protein CYJ10_28570 [Cupriavidus pauculus]|uniref:Uncharacterized protein n=1 Tax=Cupriavidus pauculus TaxID=82633 RepID=A0A2N5C4Y0_9BURK|nr:hypothetical protein CYJ10_28570 [Cupriavidus pauculus]